MNSDILKDIEEVKLSKALIFCDIDGIWADCSHRLPYLEKKEYDKFYGACMADDGKTMMACVATMAFISGIIGMYDSTDLVMLTGRPERTKTLTKLWLKANYPCFFQELKDEDILCRKDDDWRPAQKVKADLASTFLNNPKYKGAEYDIYFIDDDPKVISYLQNSFIDHLPMDIWDAMKGCIHPILMDAGRLASSFGPSKSPEE